MNYNISVDLKTIRTLTELTQEEFAKEIGVEPITIIRAENSEFLPSEGNLDKIYDYAYSKKIYLNLLKAMLYKEKIGVDSLLLFHGAKSVIKGEIDISVGRENNDFGKGFYCGENYDQTVSFISRFKESCVYFISFNPTSLKSIQYSVDKDWMLSIAYFRGKLDKYKNSTIIKRLIDKLENVDYVVAPIADNRMFQIIDSFIEGEITDEQCIHCLAATQLGYQYVFISQKSISQLHILERCYLSKSEKQYYCEIKTHDTKIGDDKSKLARIEYRGKGQYIDEMLK